MFFPAAVIESFHVEAKANEEDEDEECAAQRLNSAIKIASIAKVELGHNHNYFDGSAQISLFVCERFQLSVSIGCSLMSDRIEMDSEKRCAYLAQYPCRPNDNAALFPLVRSARTQLIMCASSANIL